MCDEVPLVSIVAPSYNHGRYIEACLDSIMFQDYANIELIIIDDASTDDSHERIQLFLDNVETETVSYASGYDESTDCLKRTYHKRYPQSGRKIVYLKNKSNIGSTATYNRGFKVATGKYCTFVATDDLIHPMFVSSLVKTLESTGADFAYADMLIIDDAHRIIREFKVPDYSFQACFSEWYLCGVATLYRKALHDYFGMYDEMAAADDHECYFRFAVNGARFVHVPKTLYSVRSHDDRQVGLHAPERFARLIEYSKSIVLQARHIFQKTIR